MILLRQFRFQTLYYSCCFEWKCVLLSRWDQTRLETELPATHFMKSLTMLSGRVFGKKSKARLSIELLNLIGLATISLSRTATISQNRLLYSTARHLLKISCFYFCQLRNSSLSYRLHSGLDNHEHDRFTNGNCLEARLALRHWTWNRFPENFGTEKFLSLSQF